jgi:hypothetical protein
LDFAVDRRRIAAGHPADDVADPGGPAKRGTARLFLSSYNQAAS